MCEFLTRRCQCRKFANRAEPNFALSPHYPAVWFASVLPPHSVPRFASFSFLEHRSSLIPPHLNPPCRIQAVTRSARSCTLKLTKKQVPVEAQKTASSNGRKFVRVAVEPTFGNTEDAGGFGHAEQGTNDYCLGRIDLSRLARRFESRGLNGKNLESGLVHRAHRRDLLSSSGPSSELIELPVSSSSPLIAVPADGTDTTCLSVVFVSMELFCLDFTWKSPLVMSVVSVPPRWRPVQNRTLPVLPSPKPRLFIFSANALRDTGISLLTAHQPR